MRTVGARFLALSLMLAGPLLLSSPVPLFAAAFPNDDNAHFCKNSGAEHVDQYEPITQNTHKFVACKRNSGATEWYFVVRRGTQFICQQPPDDPNTPEVETYALPPDTIEADCNTTNTGYYKATVYWKVGSSSFMSHYDMYKK